MQLLKKWTLAGTLVLSLSNMTKFWYNSDEESLNTKSRKKAFPITRRREDMDLFSSGQNIILLYFIMYFNIFICFNFSFPYDIFIDNKGNWVRQLASRE